MESTIKLSDNVNVAKELETSSRFKKMSLDELIAEATVMQERLYFIRADKHERIYAILSIGLLLGLTLGAGYLLFFTLKAATTTFLTFIVLTLMVVSSICLWFQVRNYFLLLRRANRAAQVYRLLTESLIDAANEMKDGRLEARQSRLLEQLEKKQGFIRF